LHAIEELPPEIDASAEILPVVHPGVPVRGARILNCKLSPGTYDTITGLSTYTTDDIYLKVNKITAVT
jgi:hypothetical protein